MDKFSSENAIIEVIAENLKKLRESRNLSLDRLSEITGVSKSMLGQIERSESNPSISILWKIATGLNVSFTYLLEKQEGETVVINNKDMIPLESDNDGFKLYPIFSCTKDRSFEILYIKMGKDSISKSLAHGKGTNEYVLVFKGEMKIILNGEEFIVREGSSISYDADIDHIYENSYDGETELYMIIDYKD